MSIGIQSTTAKLNNVKKARKVIDSYEISGITFSIDKKGYLSAFLDDDDSYGPVAVKADHLPDPDDYPNDDEWFDAVMEVELEEGDEGFKALLGELTACLKTPLMILEFSTEPFIEATGWLLDPTTKKVEILGVGI